MPASFWMSFRWSSATYTVSEPGEDTTAMPPAGRNFSNWLKAAPDQAQAGCLAQPLHQASHMHRALSAGALLASWNCPGPVPWVPKASWGLPVGPSRWMRWLPVSATWRMKRSRKATSVSHCVHLVRQSRQACIRDLVCCGTDAPSRVMANLLQASCTDILPLEGLAARAACPQPH